MKEYKVYISPLQKAVEYMMEFGTEKAVDIADTMIDISNHYKDKDMIKYFESVKKFILLSTTTGNS